jgi:hypothetical protein
MNGAASKAKNQLISAREGRELPPEGADSSARNRFLCIFHSALWLSKDSPGIYFILKESLMAAGKFHIRASETPTSSLEETDQGTRLL